MKRPQLVFATAVLAGVTLLGACNLSGPGGSDDKSIVTGVQSRLFQDPDLKTRDIHVDSQKGVVTLTGTVATELEKSAVERIANQEKGVKQVVDQLNLSGPSAAMAPSPADQQPQQEPAPPARHRERRNARHRSRTVDKSADAGTETASNAEAQQSPPAAAVAAQPQPAPVVQQAPPPPPPPPLRLTIPAGTVVTVRTIDAIDSAVNSPGQEFAATVEAPVAVGERVVIPHNSDARIRLVDAKTSGRMTGSSNLQLELVSLTANGTTYNVHSGYYEARGVSRGRRTAETVGGGAALGAIIGAIAGGRKGAGIGAGVGAGAGGGVQAASRGQQVKIPSETKIDFTLKAPFTVTIDRRGAE
jgi:BON domain